MRWRPWTNGGRGAIDFHCGDRVPRKKDSARCRIDTRTDEKIDEGSRSGSAGGRGGRIPQRKGAESTGQWEEFVKVTRGGEGGSSGW